MSESERPLTTTKARPSAAALAAGAAPAPAATATLTADTRTTAFPSGTGGRRRCGRTLGRAWREESLTDDEGQRRTPSGRLRRDQRQCNRRRPAQHLLEELTPLTGDLLKCGIQLRLGFVGRH